MTHSHNSLEGDYIAVSLARGLLDSRKGVLAIAHIPYPRIAGRSLTSPKARGALGRRARRRGARGRAGGSLSGLSRGLGYGKLFTRTILLKITGVYIYIYLYMLSYVIESFIYPEKSCGL